jgi:hypothetical protein
MRRLSLLLVLAPVLASAQKSDLEVALSKPILVPNQPLIEVQVYTAARVKSMPLVATAQQWDQASERIRSEVLNNVVLRGEAKRWSEAKTRVEWLETLPGPG